MQSSYMIKLYGINNCNTVKKARLWLTHHHIDFEFIDFKKLPPQKEDIQFWLKNIPREILINRKGTTWRKLSENEQSKVLLSDEEAITVMLSYPSIIKRPILIFEQNVIIGFDENQYQTLFTTSIN